MAETLGSLIDKLTIKEIREFHLRQMHETGDKKFSRKSLEKMLKTLGSQKQDLSKELDEFISRASKGKFLLKDEKLKLYNAPEDMGRIPETKSLGEAISGLAHKNLELWHLEDEARRSDVGLDYIGQIKHKIDFANQQRNDFIDKIDDLFEKKITQGKL
jgi:hypothetical protein